MYSFRRRCVRQKAKVLGWRCAERGTTSVWLVWIVALMLLISFGIAYRALASRLQLVVDTPVALPVLLTNLPRRIGSWVGRDIPIPANVQRAAGNDAFLKRLYRDETRGQWVNVYIAYTAHPRTMLGHRPRICYVAGGWVHDSTQTVTIHSSTGRAVPCLLHHFHRPAPSDEEIIVMNFYIVNGQLTSDDGVFSGVGWRTPNISGDPARYVTQVQISSSLENSIRTAAEDMVEMILDFFPDENGRVRAVEYVDPSTGMLR